MVVIVFSDSTAQDGDHSNSQVTVGSNTFMAVNVVTGIVANVVPIVSGTSPISNNSGTLLVYLPDQLSTAVANIVWCRFCEWR